MISPDSIISSFVEKITSIEPAFVEGIYLTGSISLNDFYPHKSDIDFLVFCSSMPDERIVSKIKEIHRGFEKLQKKPDLSGSYLFTASILSGIPEHIKVLSYHEGKLKYQNFEMGTISLWELKQNGITLFGIPAESLEINIGQSELNNFLYKNINSYWSSWLERHSSYLNRKILLLTFPRFTEWVILGIARQLCTLHTGRIVSKSEAGEFVLKHLPPEFHSIVLEALHTRKDDRSYPFIGTYRIEPSFFRLKQTIDCAQFMISAFNRMYNEQPAYI